MLASSPLYLLHSGALAGFVERPKSAFLVPLPHIHPCALVPLSPPPELSAPVPYAAGRLLAKSRSVRSRPGPEPRTKLGPASFSRGCSEPPPPSLGPVWSTPPVGSSLSARPGLPVPVCPSRSGLENSRRTRLCAAACRLASRRSWPPARAGLPPEMDGDAWWIRFFEPLRFSIVNHLCRGAAGTGGGGPAAGRGCPTSGADCP